MNHPYEDLAEYLDDALAPQERARVEEHLASCPECRADIEAARRGRDGLARLPELTQPDGMVIRASRQVNGPTPPEQAPEAPASIVRARRWQVATLAAAAVIAVLFVGGGYVRSQRQMNDLAMSGAAASMPESAGAPILDPSAGQLQDLATAERDAYAANEGVARDVTGTGTTSDVEESAVASPTPVYGSGETPDDLGAIDEPSTAMASPAPAPNAPSGDAATKAAFDGLALEYSDSSKVEQCLRESGGFDGGGKLLRTYRGDASGVPAYFGVFLQGDKPGAKADRIAVWVAAQKGCHVLGFAQAYLTYPSPSPAPEGFDWPTPPAP